MKFFACSRCLAADPSQSSRQRPVQDITDPLVVTKRVVPKALNSRKEEEAPVCRGKKRFSGLFSAFRKKPKHRSYSTPLAQNSRKTVVVIEPALKRRPASRYRAPTKTQRLIRMYEERAKRSSDENITKDRVITSACNFTGNDSVESHENFKNKFNTLDFKRMNTVALEEPSKSIECKNSYKRAKASPLAIDKFARKTMLDDILKERMKIEQTMIDLLNGEDPGSLILKKSANDEKKVRFKEDSDEQEKHCIDVTADKNNVIERETEIKLNIDSNSKVEDFYVEKTTTYMQNKTIEDKALILKIGPKDDEIDIVEPIGNARDTEIVFRNFGKITL